MFDPTKTMKADNDDSFEAIAQAAEALTARRQHVLNVQREALHTSIQTMNRGVRMFMDGRDSRCMPVFKPALQKVRRAMALNVAYCGGASNPYARNNNDGSGEHTNITKTMYRLRDLMGPASSPAASSSDTSAAPTSPPVSASRANVSATANGTLTNSGNSVANIQQQQQQQARSLGTSTKTVSSSCGTNAIARRVQDEEEPDQEYIQRQHEETMNWRQLPRPRVGGDIFVFDDIHVSVPIHKRFAKAPPATASASSSIIVDNDNDESLTGTSSPSYHFFNQAVILSEDEILSGKVYHHDLRRLDYEDESDVEDDEDCYEDEDELMDWDDDLDEIKAVQTHELIEFVIELEFMQMILPIVSASIVYNMALLFDVQSRCIRDVNPAALTQPVRRTGSSSLADSHSRLREAEYFARKAYDLYATAQNMVNVEHWRSIGTASLLRIFALNNRAVLRIERRVGNADDPGFDQVLQSSASYLTAMIRYHDVSFTPPTLDDRLTVHVNDGVFIGSLKSKRIRGIRTNVRLWRLRVLCNFCRQKEAVDGRLAPAA